MKKIDKAINITSGALGCMQNVNSFTPDTLQGIHRQDFIQINPSDFSDSNDSDLYDDSDMVYKSKQFSNIFYSITYSCY